MSESDLTRTERYYQRVQAKRYRAEIRKRGICFACMHREVTFDVHHCRRQPERQGACTSDGQAPRFEFDPEVLKKLTRAA